jgi:hypothetical protein
MPRIRRKGHPCSRPGEFARPGQPLSIQHELTRMFNSMPVGTQRDLARCWRVNSFDVVTLHHCTFPRLNLQRMIYFSEIEGPCTGRTLAIRQARNIKPVVRKIRISVAIAENTTTVAPLALVERRDFLRRRLLEHDPPHRTMVKIAQRKTLRFGIRLHGCSQEGIPPG